MTRLERRHSSAGGWRLDTRPLIWVISVQSLGKPPLKKRNAVRSGGLHALRFLEGLCRLVGYHARKVFDKAILCPNAYSWLIRHWFRKESSLTTKKVPTSGVERYSASNVAILTNISVDASFSSLSVAIIGNLTSSVPISIDQEQSPTL